MFGNGCQDQFDGAFASTPTPRNPFASVSMPIPLLSLRESYGVGSLTTDYGQLVRRQAGNRDRHYNVGTGHIG